MKLDLIADRLVGNLAALRFAKPVTHVYNPLEYARKPFRQYVRKYGRGIKEVVLVGMNPGPWGMAQTGVPFGAVGMVRDWLGITADVGGPSAEHPKRPVSGFACPREEVSGTRVWGWARDTFTTPRRFFERFFIVNYCPLLFLEATGRNRTPDKLPKRERAPLQKACDQALRETIHALRARHVIAFGVFAETRVRVALDGMDLAIGRILHPSPANPEANRGWSERATAQLRAQGIDVPTMLGSPRR